MGRLFTGILIVGLCSCGGGGGGSSSTTTDATSGTISLTASVTSPTVSSNIAVAKGASVGKAVTESAADGKTVVAHDRAGTEIGTGCTTGADGQCTVTGLTAAQLQACVTIISDAEGVPVHSQRCYTEAEATAAATTAPTVPVNTEEDIAYAVAKNACSGDLATCTTDLSCIIEAIPSMIGDTDDTANTSTLGGYAEAIFQAHATAIAGGTAGTNPADLLKTAMDGSADGFVGIAGATIGDVPVTDAATNFKTFANSFVPAFCPPDDTTGKSPWKQAKDDAEAAGETFLPRAVMGLYEQFTPTEVVNYETTHLRGFLGQIPNIEGGFAALASGPKPQLMMRGLFREGAFQDPTRAGPAVGIGFAAFPPAVNGVFDFADFDPDQRATAAHNTFLEYVDQAGTTFAPPGTLRNNFDDLLLDSTHRAAMASGGKAGTNFIAGFVADPSGFVPSNFTGVMLKPPGAACTADADCLPCDTCTNALCTSGSPKMGTSCANDSACDEITSCNVPIFAIAGATGQCMCASVLSNGANVVNAAGTAGTLGVTAGFVPPPPGNPGGTCSTISPLQACSGALACSNDNGPGVCMSDDFKLGDFSPCTSNDKCASGTCTDGHCAQNATSATGTKPVGAACFGGECTLGSMCQAGTCALITNVCAACSADTSSLKTDGASCTAPNECGSGFCSSGVCAQNTSGAAGVTNQPDGALCNDGPQCASGFCNFGLSPAACSPHPSF